MDDEKYLYLYSVEAVNGYVKKGLPFRDAYHKVAEEINSGKFSRPKNLFHTHEGRRDKLSNQKITIMMDKVLNGFKFEKV